MSSPKKTRKIPTAAQLEKRLKAKHKKGVSDLFLKLGFKRVETDGIQFTYKDRQSEIDDVFIFENIIVLVEYTIQKTVSDHLLKKKIIYDLIHENHQNFIGFAKNNITGFGLYLDEDIPLSYYEIRIVYASLYAPPESATAQLTYVNYLYGSTELYFRSLIKTIEKSARVEFFKFIGVELSDIGDNKVSSHTSKINFNGFKLKELNSGYPSGTEIITFYAEPKGIIDISYVLRKDGWRDSSHLYQRIIQKTKIKQMRKYLADEKRVFVNNIIVSLPKDSKIEPVGSEETSAGKADLVTIELPMRFDTIGIIDGQHRLFCYHESSGNDDEKIERLRTRQHLLVTGILFPADMSEQSRSIHEAKLFLEINDKQARARASLKQDIEALVKPCSTISIAKSIVEKMASTGIYKDMLQTNYFDPPIKIKTSSIVNYGLKPLIKFSGNDSLFSSWNNENKNNLKLQDPYTTSQLLTDYIEYCNTTIRDFFVSAKTAMTELGAWDLSDEKKSPLLNPTAINGLINCLRLIIENKKDINRQFFDSGIEKINSIDFTIYRSSNWRKLGEDIYNVCFR